jgi:hypothetical protein
VPGFVRDGVQQIHLVANTASVAVGELAEVDVELHVHVEDLAGLAVVPNAG